MKPLFPDVIVNGEKIPSAAIAAEAQNHSAPAGKPGLAWRAAAQALVVRQLLLQAAAAENLIAESLELEEGKIEAEDDALIRVYLEEVLEAAPVTEGDVQRIIDGHDNKPEDAESLDRARNHIRGRLEQAAWGRAANSLVKDLVAKAEIVGLEMQKAG